MNEIEVTLTVKFPNEDRMQVFTRSFKDLSELQNTLPGVDGESWDVSMVPLRP